MLHLGDEAASARADSGDNRRVAAQEDAHGCDEGSGNTFHLADLIHEINSRVGIGPQQRRRVVDRFDVNAVFADTVDLREVRVSDDVRRSVEAYEAKAASLASLADLLGVEAAQRLVLKTVGDPPNHGRLANAGLPRHEEDMFVVLAALGHL